jgi:hypothetical protein
MLDRAAGGESAGDGEEDDFLVGPICTCLPLVWLLRKVRTGGVIKGKFQGGMGVGGERGRCRAIVKGRGGGKTFGGVVVDWDTACGDLGALLCVWDVAEDDVVGQAISDFECSHFYFPVFSLLYDVVRIN